MEQKLLPYDSILNIKSADSVFCLKDSLNFKSKLLEEEVKKVVKDDKIYVDCTVETLCRDFKDIRYGLLRLTDGIYSYLNGKVIVNVHKRLSSGDLVSEKFEVKYEDLLYHKNRFREHHITTYMLKPFLESKLIDLEYFKYKYISKLDFSDNFPIGKPIDLSFKLSHFSGRYALQILLEKSATDLSLSGTIKETYYSNETLYLKITLNEELEKAELINTYKSIFNENDLYRTHIDNNEITLPYYSRYIKDNKNYILSMLIGRNKHFEDKNILLQELEAAFIRKLPDYGIFVIDKLLFPMFKYSVKIDKDDEQKIIIESLYSNNHLNNLIFYRPMVEIVVNNKEQVHEILSDVKELILKVNNS